MLKINKNKTAMLVGVAMFCLIFQPNAFGDSKDATFDLPFTLKVEETADIGSELHLALLGISDDSRCPADVTCIWEGTVSAKVNLASDKNSGNYTISLGTTGKQIFDGYFVGLTAVEPYPATNTSIKQSDYTATFLVSKIETHLVAPLKQFRAGIPVNDIQCNTGLVMVIKSSGSSPACVSSNTMEKLLLRGWEEIKNTGSAQPIIKTGIYAGHCIGYCTKEFTITPEKITYIQNGREFVSDKWLDLPEKTKEIRTSQAEWSELVNLVDFPKFDSLPDRIGCPGCADAPVEWIEISHDGKTKRIEFEHEDKIPEIAKLITALQEIRNTAESSINSFEECVSAGNAVMESYPRQCRTDDGRNFVEEINSKRMSSESLCKKYGGNWVQEFSECEAISEEQCSDMNGEFNECESACRHMPESTACTMQCVQVCTVP